MVNDGRYHHPGRQVHMPFLSHFVDQESATPGAKVFRYVADAPTTTTQRLKSMTTGSLPVFFDISNAFSASSVDEDNLIDQFVSSGKRLVFMGDSTWDGLYPTQFNESHSFPCYNIMDLDTVDDGIDKLLLPTIRNHETNPWDVIIAHYLGVDHAGHAHGVESEPMRKKLTNIDNSIQEVVETLHKEGLSDVLVLVTGDHGQTLTGDHGGGSPEEVDSVLVAIDVDQMHLKEKHLSDLGEKCVLDCSCGDERNQCVPDLTQIDLVPTLAGFMNVPIPFVNLGKVSKSLWSIMESNRCKSSFMDILKANSNQVFKYLDTYANKKGARFPSSTMDGLRKDFLFLKENKNATEMDYIEFLSIMEQSARGVWTQFHEGWMLAGVVGFFVVVSFQLSVLYLNIHLLPKDSQMQSIMVWVLSFVHPIGIFSFFFLLGEGLYLSYLVFALALGLFLLQVFRESNLLSASKGLAFVAFSCLFIAKLGLQSHSGFAFWQRLTVHDGSNDVADQHFRDYLSSKASQWLQASTALSIDPNHLDYGMQYLIPGLLILYVEDVWMKRSLRNGGLAASWYHLPMYTGFTSMLMYHILQHLDGWAQMNLTQLLGYENDSLIWLNEPLEILLPGICFASTVAMLSVAMFGRVTRRVEFTGTLASLRAAMVLLILVISPILTPLVMLGLYFEIYGIYLLLGDSGARGIHWLSITACMTVIQSQAFFISGHLCEFSGLLYTAAFVGQKDYDLVRSGLLLGIDTCGCMVLVILISLSISDMHSHTSTKTRLKEKQRPMLHLTEMIVMDVCLDQPVLGSLVTFGFTRSMVCFSAMVSAGIQRRHLYAWALFAPKLVFEIFFLTITSVVLIFVSFLL